MKKIIFEYLNVKFPDKIVVVTPTQRLNKDYFNVVYGDTVIADKLNNEYHPTYRLTYEISLWFNLSEAKSRYVIADWIKSRMS